MTVRYKSATVDEFIEHHSHDVSRGGIFIKTPSPFLPGTLLKFEIRIADDKPMLQGVGRVVWKREAAGAGPDKPAGMGVKFIKVDEASRALIDRLVTSKGGGVSAYDAEAPLELAATSAAVQPATQPRAAPNPAPVGAAPARPAGVAPVGPAIRKATMIGLGINAAAAGSAPPPSKGRSQAPRPAEPMFPKTNSEMEMPPPEERTVMKQAAQLLEEALKGAGGSIDEVGSAPVAVDPPRSPPAREPPAPSHEIAEPFDRAGSAKLRSAESPPASARPRVPAHIPLDRHPATAPSKDVPLSQRQPARAVSSVPPADSMRKKSSGGRATMSLLLVASAAAVAYVALQKKEVRAPEPISEPAVPAVTVPPPVPSPVLSVLPPVESAPAVASAAPPTSASAAPVAKPGAPAVTQPGAPGKPAVAAPAEKPASVEKPVVEKPAPVEKPPPVVAAPKPKPAPKPPPEEGATPPPEKKPKPAPKPSDDNPY